MIRTLLCLVTCIVFIKPNLFAQDAPAIPQSAVPVVTDSLYREDQFYVGLSFNLLVDQPDQFSQNGFSGGLHFGFIRDMPFTSRRNWAVGIGLGLSTNVNNSNLVIDQSQDGNALFSLFDDSERDQNSNRFYTSSVEIPLQLRWRTSTVKDFSFWRIYAGMTLGYMMRFRSVFKNSNRRIVTTNPQGLQRLQYAATLTVGNGSFNAFIHYNLNSLFTTSEQNLVEVELVPIKIGVIFYLL